MPRLSDRQTLRVNLLPHLIFYPQELAEHLHLLPSGLRIRYGPSYPNSSAAYRKASTFTIQSITEGSNCSFHAIKMRSKLTA